MPALGACAGGALLACHLSARAQVRVLRKLHHRNIVQFYGACLEPGAMFFVTELMKGGDLYRCGRAATRLWCSRHQAWWGALRCECAACTHGHLLTVSQWQPGCCALLPNKRNPKQG